MYNIAQIIQHATMKQIASVCHIVCLVSEINMYVLLLREGYIVVVIIQLFVGANIDIYI